MGEAVGGATQADIFARELVGLANDPPKPAPKTPDHELFEKTAARAIHSWRWAPSPAEHKEELIEEMFWAGARGQDFQGALSKYAERRGAPVPEKLRNDLHRLYSGAFMKYGGVYDLATAVALEGEGAERKFVFSIMAVPEPMRGVFRGFVTELSERRAAGEREGLKKAAISMRRGGQRIIESTERSWLELRRFLQGEGEEDERFRHNVEFLHQVADSRRGADPIKGTNWFSQGFYDALEMAPMVGATAALAIAGNPTLGKSFWVMNRFPEALDAMTDLGISEDYARPAALISAIADAQLEYLGLKMFLSPALQASLGKALRGAMMDYGKKRIKAMAPGAARLGVTFLGEWTIETIQGLKDVVVPLATSLADPEAPVIDVKKQLEEFYDEMLRAGPALAFMMAPGVGVGALANRAKTKTIKAEMQKALSDNITAIADRLPRQAEAPVPPAAIVEVAEPVVPAEVAEPLPAYGSENRFVSNESYEESLKAFREKMGRVQMGIPLDAIPDLAKMGAYHFEAGLRKFTSWSAQMLEDFGEDVKPHLRKVWNQFAATRDLIVKAELAEGKRVESLRSPQEVKRRIKAQRDWPKGEKIPVNANELLRYSLKHEVKGVAEGQLALSATQQEVLAFAERTLPPYEYKAVAKIAKQVARARTPKQFANVITATNKLAAKAQSITEWPGGPKVIATVSQLNKLAFQHQAKGARIGYRAGQLDMVANMGEVIQFAKEHLPKEFPRFAPLFQRVTRMRTPAQKRLLIKSINTMAANYERQSAVLEAKQALKEIQGENLAPEFKVQLDQLTEGFAVSQPRPETLRRMESIVRAADIDSHLESPEGRIPKKLIDRARTILGQADKPLLSDMQPSELREITHAVQEIAQQNLLKTDLLNKSKHRLWEDTLTAIETQTDDRHKRTYQAEPQLREPEGWQSFLVRPFTSDELSHETQVFRLAGDDGLAYEMLVDRMWDGQSETTRWILQGQDYLAAKLKEAGVTREQLLEWSEPYRGLLKRGRVPTVWVPLPKAVSKKGKRVPGRQMTRGERIECLRQFSDSDTRALILKNTVRGIEFKGIRGGPIRLYIEDMLAIERSATAQEQAVAKAMQEFINGPLHDAWQTVWQAQHGWKMETRPDYCPRRRKFEDTLNDPNRAMAEWLNRNLDDMGIWKARTGGTQPVVIGDAFERFAGHTSKVAAYIGKAVPAEDASRLVSHERFRDAVKRSFKHGEQMLAEFEEVIRDYQGIDYSKLASLEKLVRWLLHPAHIGALGWKPHIVVYQAVSLLNALTEIDANYLLDPRHIISVKAIEEMKAWSPPLRARIEGRGHGILTPELAPEGLHGMFGQGRGLIEKTAMKPIAWMDSRVMVAIWEAAKEEGADLHNLSGDELMRYAAKATERTMRRTQPTWDLLTTSRLNRLARKNPLVAPLLMFTSQRNKNFNMVIRAVSEYRHAEDKVRAFPKMIAKVALPTLVNATFIYAIKHGAWAIMGRKEPQKFTDHLFSVFEVVLGQWLLVGDIGYDVVKAIRSGLEKERFFRPEWNILAAGAESAIRGVHNAVKAASQAANDERYMTGVARGEPKMKYTAIRAAEDMARATAIFLGVPLQAVLQYGKRHIPVFKEAYKKQEATRIVKNLNVLLRWRGKPKEWLQTKEGKKWRKDSDEALWWLKNIDMTRTELLQMYLGRGMGPRTRVSEAQARLNDLKQMLLEIPE